MTSIFLFAVRAIIQECKIWAFCQQYDAYPSFFCVSISMKSFATMVENLSRYFLHSARVNLKQFFQYSNLNVSYSG